MVQFSHPYMTTEKTIALTIWTFVSKVMSLLFNILSRFIITFLPRRKHLLISWLQFFSSSSLSAIEWCYLHIWGYWYFSCNLDSSLGFIQPRILHNVLCIEFKQAWWQYTALLCSFPSFEQVHCPISGSNCCFLTCLQVSQEAGKVVWYSHLSPQFVVIHPTKFIFTRCFLWPTQIENQYHLIWIDDDHENKSMKTRVPLQSHRFSY